MREIQYLVIALGLLASCSGPSYFNNPTQFVGGNRGVAVETHCRYRSGVNKESMHYRLCQEGFKTHYGK